MEQWKDIDGYNGLYQVSDMGNVRSVDRMVSVANQYSKFYIGRVLKPFKSTTCSYLTVQLSRLGVARKFMVHRLVAYGFLGLADNSKLEVNHKNGQRCDNRACNLELVTHQENIDHSVACMLKNDYGEKSTNAKLTNMQAEEIRRAYRAGATQKQLAAQYEVCKQTICDIVRYKKYFR